jgi:hypothetical protein
MPMLSAFRLMLIYTLLDPIKITVGNLFVAVGQPERVVQARSIQLAVLLGSLFLMGPIWGIAGVALAVDLMLMVGMGILFSQARAYVDFSLPRLFGVPTLALVAGLLLGRGSAALIATGASHWQIGIAKGTVFCAAYSLFFAVLERTYIVDVLNTMILPTVGRLADWLPGSKCKR